MEPTQRPVLEKFSNTPSSINFTTWKSIFIANIRSKGLLAALSEQEEDLSAAKQQAATKADAILLFDLLNSLEKEPRVWALLNHPVTEIPVPWAGYKLWISLKKKYDAKAIPQEIYLAKIKVLTLKCHGNAKGYIGEVQEARKRFFAMAELDKNQIGLLR